MTYSQLYNKIPQKQTTVLERMMEAIGDETGEFPSWNDQVDSWVLDQFKAYF